MTPTLVQVRPGLRLALALAVALPLAVAFVARPAHAADAKTITNAPPAASATSAPDARRTLRFNTRHDVAAMLTSHRATPIPYRWKAEVRFGGQTERHTCEFDAPETSVLVHDGETAVMTIRCTTPWQLYDNGLSFEAFEGGREVAEGTLRP